MKKEVKVEYFKVKEDVICDICGKFMDGGRGSRECNCCERDICDDCTLVDKKLQHSICIKCKEYKDKIINLSNDFDRKSEELRKWYREEWKKLTDLAKGKYNETRRP